MHVYHLWFFVAIRIILRDVQSKEQEIVKNSYMSPLESSTPSSNCQMCCCSLVKCHAECTSNAFAQVLVSLICLEDNCEGM